jgi:hypothetical protein
MRKPISVDMNGKTYEGHFEVSGGVLTVTAEYGQKATQLGQMLPTVLAAALLRELLLDEKSRKGRRRAAR